MVEVEQHWMEEVEKQWMEEVEKHGVYEKVPVEELYNETGKAPIGTRWVDTNKGGLHDPLYRSRWAAMDAKQVQTPAVVPLWRTSVM